MPRQISPTAPVTPVVRPTRVSLEGVGDIVDAGSRSGYAHLRQRRVPTLGRLCSAAREVAAALARPALWPARRGHWQPAHRSARRLVNGRMRVSVVVLEPNSFVAAPQAPDPRRDPLEVLHLVGGRAHLIDSGPGGGIRSAAEMAPGRTRVVGSPVNGGQRGHRFLVNTGNEAAVVLRRSP